GGERVADFVGDAGGELAHGRQLLGPQQLALVPLQPLGHGLDLPDDVLHLPVEAVEVAVGHDADSRNVAVEVLGQVLDVYAEPVDRLAYRPGHAVAQHEPADRTGQPE